MIVVAVVVVIFVVFVKGVGEDSQDDLAAPSTERLGSVNSPHVMTESSSFTATHALVTVSVAAAFPSSPSASRNSASVVGTLAVRSVRCSGGITFVTSTTVPDCGIIFATSIQLSKGL